MSFKEQNDIEREYYKKDLDPMTRLFKEIRSAIATGKEVKIPNKKFDDFIDVVNMPEMLYLTVFEENVGRIRFGSKRIGLKKTLQRCIQALRENENFSNFTISDENKCRLHLEFITEKTPVKYSQINRSKLNEYRFETGITGLQLKDKEDNNFYVFPLEAHLKNLVNLNDTFCYLASKTPICKITRLKQKRGEILKEKLEKGEYELFLIKTRAFVTYKDKCLALYRGNTVPEDFSYDKIKEVFLNGSDWLFENFDQENGKFLYYLDCINDTKSDHEHKERDEDDLYYNDLRHCGGIMTLIRAYLETGDVKYSNNAKRAIDYIISITKEQKIEKETAYYTFLNDKAKLGGTGIALIALMFYRTAVGDETFDKYIIGYVRHILSRICKNGEILPYYIHPEYNNGEPLIDMSPKTKKKLFSFFYPGQALYGLMLFLNRFNDIEDELKEKVINKSKLLIDWLVFERPKEYKESFETPGDAWFIQAIDEASRNKIFEKYNKAFEYALSDAKKLIGMMYKEDETPFLDYAGAFYMSKGGPFYPDSARAEGLIAAYYLARRLNKTDEAQEILNACQMAAKSILSLVIDEKTSYAHKNPSRTIRGIKGSNTGEWIRMDNIRHTACFYAKLLWSQTPPNVPEETLV